MLPLSQFTADYRLLRDAAVRHLGLRNPVLVQWIRAFELLLSRARRLGIHPIDGVLLFRCRRPEDRVVLGLETYELDGLRFAVVRFDETCNEGRVEAFAFLAMERDDYDRLRARLERDEPETAPPILASGQLELIVQNTLGFLEAANLRKIRHYGGRPHRGLLLTGPPGSGKTLACRWLRDQCRARGWSYQLITPDCFQYARARDIVDELFTLPDRGILFFDDMDQALRAREQSLTTEEQTVMLTALDGIRVKQAVVFVFTTNCPVEQIDRAFRRPGRIDLALPIQPPDAAMRLRLLESWHAEIRATLDERRFVDDTDGYSFAEIEELKNLLVMRFLEQGTWDWSWAESQFQANVRNLTARQPTIGFREASLSR